TVMETRASLSNKSRDSPGHSPGDFLPLPPCRAPDHGRAGGSALRTPPFSLEKLEQGKTLLRISVIDKTGKAHLFQEWRQTGAARLENQGGRPVIWIILV
ncbi:MAG: hypothetical protein MUP19_02800, partial [Candidatus Aminicenantes bacterium]|nr:hypothetical protein [Candidatus Aminicenantes bacterium]